MWTAQRVIRHVLAVAIPLSIFISVGLLPSVAHAGTPVEIVYATFLDPNNKVDPRVEAQARMIEAFERANPGIQVNLVVDPAVTL